MAARGERAAGKFRKPIVIVSKCLGFGRCRYDGLPTGDEFVERLKGRVRFRPVCPEMAIGLGCPRPRIEVIETDGGRRLCQRETGRYLTRRMVGFARDFLDSVKEVDGFILKSRSPSCGIRDVKVYSGRGQQLCRRRGRGFFARAVVERFGHLGVEDERRLGDSGVREHFVTKLFVLADFRRVRKSTCARALLRFHARQKPCLEGYSLRARQRLDCVVGDCDRAPLEEVAGLYEVCLWRVLARPPRGANAAAAARRPSP